jgi:hypothetical protein
MAAKEVIYFQLPTQLPTRLRFPALEISSINRPISVSYTKFAVRVNSRAVRKSRIASRGSQL